MVSQNFQPVVYLKRECPFCMKFAIFLSEAGLLDKVKINAFFAGSEEEEAIRSELGPKLEKLSFPLVEVEPGEFRTDSDALIAHFAASTGREPADMPLLSYYQGGFFKAYVDMFMELRALKQPAA